MRLFSVEEVDRQLGYKCNETVSEVTALRGFAVAVGPRGIRAIQVICDDGTRSPWFGRLKNSPITERLVRTERIVALEIEFDGYKLVTLSVAEATSLEKISEEQKSSLRDAALWYPSVLRKYPHWDDATTKELIYEGWTHLAQRVTRELSQPSHYLLQISTIIASMYITSIPCHLSFPIFHSLKPFRHACNLFVNELLSDMSPTFIYQLFCSRIIPMRVFAKSLFHRLPIVFDRSQIWRTVTVWRAAGGKGQYFWR